MIASRIVFMLLLFRISKLNCIAVENSIKYQLSIIHTNDFHARYEEVNPNGGECKDDNCVGGFSRLYTELNRLVKDRPNSIVLNAGDNFQGTFWYNVYKWNITQHFFNLLPIDVSTLGNHEFDGGIEELVLYLKHLRTPVVVANINNTGETKLQGLYQKSVVIEKNGIRVGIIGVIAKDTNELSLTGKVRFLDESKSVNKEAKRLMLKEKVDTIIVVSHCGYEAEKLIAKNAAKGIGIVVGGHSHSFLYTGEPLPGSDKPEGPYPTVVEHEDGRKILVVQAGAHSKYIGNITVYYDQIDNVHSWSGAPIYLNKSIPQDFAINEELDKWKSAMRAAGNTVVGYTNVMLNSEECGYEECNLGNFISDAMVYNYLHTDEKDAWAYSAIGIVNCGSLRSSIPIGNVSYVNLVNSIPYENHIHVGEIRGDYLKEMLEHAVLRLKYEPLLLHVSGIQVTYNMTKPVGARIENLKLRCRDCEVPIYEEFVANKYYRIVINSFIAFGGDGFAGFLNHMNIIKDGPVLLDAVIKYTEARSPIFQELNGRIKFVK